MRYSEIAEQGTIGSTPLPTAGGSTIPTTAAPTAPSGLTGNVAALQDPKMQAANLAKQKQQKDQQKKENQDQIAALQKQLADLNRTA